MRNDNLNYNLLPYPLPVDDAAFSKYKLHEIHYSLNVEEGKYFKLETLRFKLSLDWREDISRCTFTISRLI